MNISDFLPTSWVQAHAAITHFPIALLLVAVALEGGGLLFRRAVWREIAFLILTLAVISLPFSLLSGYLTGRAMGRPPVGFDLHWKTSLVATACASAWWIWRWRIRKQAAIVSISETLMAPEKFPMPRPNGAQWAMLGLAGLSALSVGYTGHLGGEMVFGSGDDDTAASTVPVESDDNRMEKIALAAGKMENAAGQLDVATDRLALAAQNRKPTAPAPAPTPLPPTVIAAPPSEVKIDASALERAAQKMENVAARFETTAQKLDAIAQQMQSASAAQSKGTAKPTKKGAPDKQSQAPPPNKSTTITQVIPTQAPARAAFDPQLVALGTKLFQSDDLGCAGCHKINGKGGRGGPDLTNAGRLHPDIEWQIAHLKKPDSKIPGSKMPAYDDVPENDLRALAHYMVSLQ